MVLVAIAAGAAIRSVSLYSKHFARPGTPWPRSTSEAIELGVPDGLFVLT